MNELNQSSTLPLGVVTVTYSPGNFLEPFLLSLESAYEGETLTILADNGSTDGVPQRAAQRANVEFLDTGGNIGYGGGMNAGVARLAELAAAGKVRDDYFLIVNPDVAFHPGSLDALLECITTWPHAAAVGPRIEETDGGSYPSARAVPTLEMGVGHALFSNIWPSNPWSASYRREKDLVTRRTAGWLSGACVLVNWEAFTQVGGFDERYFMYLEDVDLGDRFNRAGWVNVFCPEAVISHAQGHATKAHAKAMTRAHHESAYRFQADRHARWFEAPLRWILKFGLFARALYAIYAKEKVESAP